MGEGVAELEREATRTRKKPMRANERTWRPRNLTKSHKRRPEETTIEKKVLELDDAQLTLGE